MFLKHLEIVYNLKFHSDIREGIKEAKRIAWWTRRTVTIMCNEVTVFVERDSSVEDVVVQYHKAMKHKDAKK